jgi:hypothetical protein
MLFSIRTVRLPNKPLKMLVKLSIKALSYPVAMDQSLYLT